MVDKERDLEKIEDSIRYAELALKSLNQGLDSLQRQYAEARKVINDHTLTQGEAAGLIGCHRRTVARKLKAGELKSLKVNDVLEFKRTQG